MVKKVCLDPGHGVETAGKRSPDGAYRECEFALDMARRIKLLLEQHGVEVILTRSDEHDVSLAQRVKIANTVKGLDLFVSLHSNAAGSGAQWMSARGLLVYVYASSRSSTSAGQYILDHQAQAGVKVRNNGRPTDGSGLYVLRKTSAPAILVEHLFHDNREDTALLMDSDYRQRMARADANGILDYLGVARQNNKEEGAYMPTKQELEKMVQDMVQEAVKRELDRHYFETLLDVPESYQAVLSRLMETGALTGYDGGADGLLATKDDNNIRVDETLCRVFTIMARPEAQEALFGSDVVKLYQTIEECPQWAQEAVKWAVEAGYIEGDQSGALQLNAFKIWVLQVEYNKYKAAMASEA